MRRAPTRPKNRVEPLSHSVWAWALAAYVFAVATVLLAVLP